MNGNCLCKKNDYLSGEQARRFYYGQEWKEYPSEEGKIIECPFCQSLWDLIYQTSKDDFIIERKFKHPEILLNKYVHLVLGKSSNPEKEFLENKIVKVFDDDKRMIVELSWDWIYEDKKIRFLFIQSTYPGYLSDLFNLQISHIEVTIAYQIDFDLSLDSASEESFVFKWQGNITKAS